MIEPGEGREHPYIELIAREAQRTVAVDRAARTRLLAAIRAEPIPQSGIGVGRLVSWLIERHRWNVSPLAAGALGIALLVVGLMSGSLTSHRDGRGTEQLPAVAASMPSLPVSNTTVFTFVAPEAKSVAIVGDFNQWDSTPMVRVNNSNVWRVAIALAPGRHTYSFVVKDGNGEWMAADPQAPLAPVDGLGQASSVVVVDAPE